MGFLYSRDLAVLPAFAGWRAPFFFVLPYLRRPRMLKSWALLRSERESGMKRIAVRRRGAVVPTLLRQNPAVRHERAWLAARTTDRQKTIDIKINSLTTAPCALALNCRCRSGVYIVSSPSLAFLRKVRNSRERGWVVQT
jgi:hypothetical protein